MEVVIIGIYRWISEALEKGMLRMRRVAMPLCVLGLMAGLVSCQGMINKGAVINGQKFYDRGNYDKAIEQLRVAETDNVEAQLLIARSYDAKGDRDLAKAQYSVLARKYPDTAEGVYSKNKLKNF